LTWQAVFHDAGFQHPSDQAKNSLVRDPLLLELEQPSVIHSIEKAAYVGLNDVVYTLLLDGLPQRIQALMRTTPGPVACDAPYQREFASTFRLARIVNSTAQLTSGSEYSRSGG